MMDSETRRWKFAVERYERLLQLSRIASTMKAQEYVADGLAQIEAEFPTCAHVFADMRAEK